MTCTSWNFRPLNKAVCCFGCRTDQYHLVVRQKVRLPTEIYQIHAGNGPLDVTLTDLLGDWLFPLSGAQTCLHVGSGVKVVIEKGSEG